MFRWKDGVLWPHSPAYGTAGGPACPSFLASSSLTFRLALASACGSKSMLPAFTLLSRDGSLAPAGSRVQGPASPLTALQTPCSPIGLPSPRQIGYPPSGSAYLPTGKDVGMDPGRPSRPAAGLFDPPSRTPRFILYIFLVLTAIVFLPGLNEVRPLVVAALLLGGPAIAFLAIRAWRTRESLATVPRLIVETGVVFGPLLFVLALLDLFGIRRFGG